MLTAAALTVWLIVGAQNGEYLGSRVFDNKEQCEFVSEILHRNYKDMAVSDCIEVPVFGTGEVKETNEAP